MKTKLITLLLLLGALLPAQLRRHEIELYPNVAGTLTGELRFEELRANGTNYVGFQAGDSIAATVIWTLPTTDSTGSQCLSSNGSAVLGWSACSAGSSAPFADTTSIVEGSVDNTKEIRFEVDGLTTGTVRVLTPPNADITIAGINLAQTWTATQTFRAVLPSADSTYLNGNVGAAWQGVWSDNFYTQGPHASEPIVRIFEDTGGGLVQIQDDDTADTPETVAIIGADSGSNGYVELFVGDGAAAGLSLAYLGSTSGDGILKIYESAGTGNIEFRANGTTPDLLLTMTAGANVLPATANSHDLGGSGAEWNQIFGNYFKVRSSAGTCTIVSGSGAPGGACTTCDLALRTDGGAGSTLYVCEASGWVAK